MEVIKSSFEGLLSTHVCMHECKGHCIVVTLASGVMIDRHVVGWLGIAVSQPQALDDVP